MFTPSQELVMSLLKVTPDKYSEIIYVHGTGQIALLLPGLTSLHDLESNAGFWSDFKARWAKNDEAFIDDLPAERIDALLNAKSCSGELYDAFMSYHKYDTLESFPIGVQRVVLDQLHKERKANVRT